MSVVVVVGAQWGDEGKGKVVDIMSAKAHMVVRYAGGANAGHTLVIGGKKLVTHLIPSGVLHPGTTCVLGSGMVIDPKTLFEEIDDCRAQGLLAGDELCVSADAHVIFPYHREIEGLRESGTLKIGTTRRGIGPAYESKAARKGIRIRDLMHRERLECLVRLNLEELIPLMVHYGKEPPSEETIQSWLDEYSGYGKQLAPLMTTTALLVHEAIEAGRNILFEGAQGALLDVDHGTYPFVTSSNTVAAGACTGVGVGPTRIDRVVGITKAYATRVGEGPFPTEDTGEKGESIRTAGGEYGATTGRPRRCGWMDIPALRWAVMVNGIDGLALTKLDVLSGLGPIKVCVAYEIDGVKVDTFSLDSSELERAQPMYEEYEGWEEDLTSARCFEDLPDTAQSYVRRLEALLGVPFYLVSIGPDRVETIVLRDPFAT